MLTRAAISALAAVLLGAPAAHATVVSRPDSTTLRYQGQGDVRDLVGVSLADGGTNVVFSIVATPGQSVTTQAPCVPSGPNVICPRAGITRLLVELGGGDDALNFSVGVPVPIRIEATGGAGADSLTGGTQGDSLAGGDGADVLVGLTGADDLSGGAGFDAVNYLRSDAGVTVTIDDVAHDGIDGGAEADNVRTDVEDLVGSPYADDLAGSARGNRIDGDAGNDRIDGLAGTDVYLLGSGDDSAVTRDGQNERVACGDGHDTVTADDIDEPAACEVVNAGDELVRDLDRDGVSGPEDCDDGNAAIRPGVADAPADGIDQDCDGVDPTVADRDGDGVARPADCVDTDGAIRPGAREIFGNDVDEDCSGRADPLQTVRTPILSRFVVGRRATSIRRLVVGALEAGTRVEVRCTGRRCPFTSKVVAIGSATRHLDLRARLKLRSLRGSATLEVRTLRPDSVGRVVRYRLRSGRAPSISLLCQSPGDLAPRRC